jgi:hypothetical protein
MPDDQLTFDPNWSEETLKLAYEAAVKAHAMSIDAVTSLDAKLVTVSTVATALLGLSGTVLKPSSQPASTILWVIASVFWACAIAVWLESFRARDVHVGSPKLLSQAGWMSQPAGAYRFYTIRDLGEAFDLNRAVVAKKARSLFWAMLFVAGEAFALALSVLSGHK